MKNKNRGFTFVELLVVVTIIAVITGIAIASYQSTNKKARDSRRKSDLEQIRSALELCRAEEGGYPDDIRDAENKLMCGTQSYLNPVPYDPRDGQTDYEYTYTTDANPVHTTYDLCATTMENETFPYCVHNP